MDTLERHQLHPFELWEPETVKRRSGTDRHIAGVYEPTGASVQPALLARGLRRVALSKGVRIYERTPLTRLDRSRPPRVVTPRGTLTADKVVIAMNAWATMFPELRRTIVVISSDIVATRPMPERLARFRLGRRHVHLGFPDPGELLPADRGWPRCFRHRRRETLLRQQGRRSLKRRLPARPRGRGLFPPYLSPFQRCADRDELDRAGRPLPQRTPLLRPPRRPRRPALWPRLLGQRRGAHLRRRPRPRLARPRREGRVVRVRAGAGGSGALPRASRCAMSAGAW